MTIHRTFWCALTLAASAHTFAYSPSFNTGELPKGTETVNNGATPVASVYAHGYTANGWTVDRFGSQYVAMAPTFTGSDEAAEAVLTFPAHMIEAGGIAYWTTRSALPGFAESYTVDAVEPDGSTTRLADITGEEALRWVDHCVSLEAFVGKEVGLRFTSTSHGYMLMLGSVYTGTPSKLNLSVENMTEPYATGESHSINLRVTNLGTTLRNEALTLVTGEGKGTQADMIELPEMTTLETRDFELTAPATLGNVTPWSVKLNDGTVLAEGSFYTSYFKRRHIIDKGTGMWCNNCPMGNVMLDKLKAEMGDAVIVLSTHVRDRIANDEYWAHLDFYSVPYFKLDRISETAGGNFDAFAAYYNEPTLFGIDIVEAAPNDNNTARVKLNIKAAPEVDNSDGRYKLAYVVTSTLFDPDKNSTYYQSNAVTSVSGYQYYLLPENIPAQLVRFSDVTLTSETAFTGINGSIPAEIPADGSEYVFNVACPSAISSIADARLVAYVLDTTTGRVMNATAWQLGEKYTGIESISADGALSAPALTPAGDSRLMVGRAGRLEAFDLAGRRVKSLDATPGIADMELGAGVYVVTLDGGDAVKIIVK